MADRVKQWSLGVFIPYNPLPYFVIYIYLMPTNVNFPCAYAAASCFICSRLQPCAPALPAPAQNAPAAPAAHPQILSGRCAPCRCSSLCRDCKEAQSSLGASATLSRRPWHSSQCQDGNTAIGWRTSQAPWWRLRLSFRPLSAMPPGQALLFHVSAWNRFIARAYHLENYRLSLDCVTNVVLTA
jgi:hypothetical protein